MPSHLEIVVSDTGIEFPEEIDQTFQTLLEFYENMGELGIELEGDSMAENLEQKVLAISLCG